MDVVGAVLLVVAGIAFLVGGVYMGKRKRKKMSFTDEALKVFSDYAKDMQEFKRK
ncbi:MAG TPA: LPXTG cell wall anchor domain-containing protein [Candidatus Aphodovivens excrementavium]|nr:LPXTG cell wall anchor domain-containing protein [Candidatus Aphodovivens excrementavium]